MFYTWTPPKLSGDKLDSLALSGEPLGTLGGGWQTAPESPIIMGDYKVRIVNSRGTGNHGTIILVGHTPRGKLFCRLGRIARLKKAGCPQEIAVAAASMPYGMEEPVWKLAAELLPIVKMGIKLDPLSHQEFREATGLESSRGCSLRRIRAAIAIAEKAVAN